jgi:hypothetical protein
MGLLGPSWAVGLLVLMVQSPWDLGFWGFGYIHLHTVTEAEWDGWDLSGQWVYWF